MAQELPGRVAVVTGGARGIGAATACLLAERGAGVAVIDLDAPEAVATAAAINQLGGRAIGIGCDVTNRRAVQSAFDQVAAELGKTHILVNNAGALRENLLNNATDDEWDTVMAVHLRGAFLCSQFAQRQMVDQGWGRIVNLSSVAALGNRCQAGYSAAKAGLQGFTRTLAIELGPSGVTVNAVAPGFIVTAMTRAMATWRGVDVEQFQQVMAERAQVRRVGHPDDIAHAIGYLASAEASFVTGQVLYVDGGLTLL